MKINNINTKLIKPQTPTPQNLNNYIISFLDKKYRPANFAVVLFYQGKPEVDTQLEESLAKILVQFYPLAGRYMKNNHLINCSDEGVEFVVSQALDVDLINLVTTNTDILQLKPLIPNHFFRGDDTQLMSIRVTHFPCGGLALAISVAHVVFDASSLGTFISAWSSATNRESKAIKTITPSFDLASLIPYYEDDHRVPGFASDPLPNKNHGEIIVKRLVFDKVALMSLRSKLRPNSNGKTISRVRVVCAVIAETLIRLDRAKHGQSRDLVIGQAVNMRGRTIPPQPKDACGNLGIFSLTRSITASEAMDLGVQELADLIGDAAQKTIADHVHILSPSGNGRDIITSNFEKFKIQCRNPNTNIMFFSDWSKFGFYEADFGWGKPVWTSIGPLQTPISNTILMSNKEGDGIEAWLHLNQHDIAYFDNDKDIKLFTT